MKFIESIVAKFGPDRINNLAADEERRLVEVRHYVRHGWLSVTNPARLKTAGLSEDVIADLNSNQAPRQRAAINHPSVQAYVRAEIQRRYALRSMTYFREKLETTNDFSFAKAEQILRDDSIFCFKDGFVDDTDSGRRFRRLVLFASSKDEEVLFVVAHFIRLFVSTLGSLMQKYEHPEISDLQLRQELINSLPAVTSTLTDSALRRFIVAMEQAATCDEPKAICPYMDVLRAPGLQDHLVGVQLERKRADAAERAAAAVERERIAAEQERAAAAAADRLRKEQRERLEAQLMLTVVDQCLDVTPRECVKLEAHEDFRRLLVNMQSAFARASTVRTGMYWDGQNFAAVRSLASMSAKHLACVKIDFWWNRSGLGKGDADRMFWLLNCDGRAQLHPSGLRAVAMYMGIHEGSEIDLEKAWSHNLGFLQKGIDAEGFMGELVRWFVEKEDDNGWATSR